MSASTLNTQNLSKAVGSAEGKLTIPRDLSLDLAHGDSLAVIDSSGSGKSTLLGLFARLGQSSGGEVRLAGHALGDLDEDQRACVRAAHVDFVFQPLQLLDSLDALGNVMLSLELKGHADARQRAGELLERAGLGQRLGHYPRQLSGNEQQRVAIARVFAAGPNVLFADEPTDSLDNATGKRISDLLFKLNRKCDTTLVLVAHDERPVHCCRRLIHLKSGRLTDRIKP